MSRQAMKPVVRLTKALADMQRLRILLLLVRGELCVCRIVEVIGLAPSTVSKHLFVLSAAGLVEVRKEGRWAYYRLSDGDDTYAVDGLFEWLKQALEDDCTIERDAALLDEVMTLDREEIARRQRCRWGTEEKGRQTDV